MTTTTLMIAMFLAFVIVGSATAAIAHDYGPRPTLALGLGEILFCVMCGAVGFHHGGLALWIAAGVGMVGALAIFAVAMNKWLPR